ncbi:DUF6081 family protein [Streptomyces griseocarneus]|uniref:DUF6081 family protein n=1 Tax=Streptomyces griseocarneus TaxID=51201 RepID=UPI0019AFC24F|nr:DUF6081 family protein [Streptomyces griseocarneus]MBZ6478146.1 DUF6081 family protein [Streptomyces griseocarneus]GHG84115.1 hypothetical protein GCM10018779_67440 [Streptomyces griseocarneus]
MGLRARLSATALATAMFVAFVPATANAAEDGEEGSRAVFSDNFQSGFDTTNKWLQVPVGGLPSGDGVASTSSAGLKVVPSGKDSAGNPAFAYTTGQQSAGGQGDSDHLKYLTWPRHNSTKGFPGWDSPDFGQLSCNTRMGVTTTNTDKHPFGAAVSNPQTDLRLAAGSLVSVDQETNVVFDFFVTNNTVYAFYERLRSPGSTYAAFSYAVPVANITKGQQVSYTITLDQQRTRARWKVNGSTVLTVSKIGTRALDRKYLLIDHGGTDQVVAPRQLQCALGTFTLLDGSGADGKGLVKLDSTTNSYYKPSVGAPTAQTFYDDQSLAGNRLWGQGAQLQVSSFSVSTS